MKKIALVLLLGLSLLQAKGSIDFKYSDVETRKFPTNQDYILSYNNVLKDVRTSVVNISTQKNVTQTVNPLMNDPFFREFFRGYQNIPQERIQRALGSGVIISEDGYIVTNNHVVDGADKIVVNLVGDKKEYEAKLIGKDEKSDLAVIKIEKDDLNAVSFYNSDNVKVGDVVFALGNPFGLHETITQGIVSATGRSGVGIVEYENFIQTDASINPGNSGGALINSKGDLIGINSAILSKSGGNVGIGFAIPSNMVTSIAKQLIESGKFSRAYLGVNISDISEDMSKFYNNNFGALVTGVEDETPAQKAGIIRGDLIVAVNSKEIKSASELKNIIGTFAPNTEVTIKFLRDKKLKTAEVKLGSLENISPSGAVSYNGIELRDIDAQTRSRLMLSQEVKGVIVTKVDPKSDAARIGVKIGDVVIQVENKEITNTKEFLHATKSKSKKRLFIYRRGGVFAVVL
ncbi:Do family serine endopeptidase [Sulfurimonas lithotrophica]|uniref:Do family serine endopeptidase n=1 Tax=Sulfurimonas lithotrophica TaxID=2590022 RepID=A0A5P8NXR4_9BACT|nr:Do family serine endopeptidase [Sulfurimonas lithotrophica]QFR48196.1 Do family serine endopeptidase [Sulfurimonas lithotrophica]